MAARGIPVMAYSPIEQGQILDNHTLVQLAKARGCSAAQIALAWVLSRDVIAIPKASNLAHVREDFAALEIVLRPDELAAFDRAFPPPRRGASDNALNAGLLPKKRRNSVLVETPRPVV